MHWRAHVSAGTVVALRFANGGGDGRGGGGGEGRGTLGDTRQVIRGKEGGRCNGRHGLGSITGSLEPAMSEVALQSQAGVDNIRQNKISQR